MGWAGLEVRGHVVRPRGFKADGPEVLVDIDAAPRAVSTALGTISKGLALLLRRLRAPPCAESGNARGFPGSRRRA